MRAWSLLLLAACSACSAGASPPPVAPTNLAIAPLPPPPPASAPVDPAPPPGPTSAEQSITGSIGGRPFTARIALMVARDEVFSRCSTVGKPDGKCSTATDGRDVIISTIMLFERPVTCADVKQVRGQQRGYVPLANGEHVVEIAVESRWPVAAGSVWKVAQGELEPPVSISFKRTTGSFNGIPLGDGAIAAGVVRFPSATPSGGTLSIDATSTNPKSPSAGTLRGSVPLAICR